MTPIFPELPYQLGVYTLTRLIELRTNTALYEARQTHVDRAVVLEVLQPGVPHAEEVAFLAQARHQVATSGMPHVSDVFESLRADGIWFLTQERPLGRSLADIAAEGAKLSVPHICCVVAAAAEMYREYQQDGLSAMPLAASSIYVEENGNVSFLSPLVEGVPNNPVAQMQATAAALWPLCPEEKEPGLGRAVTLLQWLNEGVEGNFLEWGELQETAVTILAQLQANARPESDKPFLIRFKERLLSHPRVQQGQLFFRQWGTYLGAAVGVVVLMSSLGTMFGMADPETAGADGKSGILCSQEGKTELVLRYPVTVQEYSDFMHEVEEMSEDERKELLDSVPAQVADLLPRDWDIQWNQGDVEAPVTGVNYWQAMLYARHKGATLPTANQIQTVLAAGAGGEELEWSRTEQESPIPGLYDGPAYLLIDAHGRPFPAASREWCDSRCGFRISYPEN